jgi:prepilin-type N-terminal cleavage/methylation domain-containing protein
MAELSLRSSSARPAASRRGFTLTEMLVVIGIIALLVGILLPALSAVQRKARRAETENLMQEFAKACENFQQQFGFYPGIVPDAILNQDPKISSTENALLHLCGGAIPQDDPNYAASPWTEVTFNGGALGNFRIKLNTFTSDGKTYTRIGEGPRIRGTQYKSFFSPKASDLVAVKGQGIGANAETDDPFHIPDLVDSWGQPIVYLRQLRENGSTLVRGATANESLNDSMFAYGPIRPYVESVELGELSTDQTASVLNAAAAANRNPTLAQIIRNVSYGPANQPNQGQKRGAIALISAGPDGVYFSKFDGIGTPNNPQTDVINTTKGPAAIEEYDDVRVFAGG